MRILLLALFLFSGTFLHARPPLCCKGRVDAGPAFYRINVLEEGKTTQTMDLFGGRLDATLLFLENSGICLKPTASGATGDGKFYSYGIGLGHYTPITDWLQVIPVIGLTWTDLRTSIDLDVPTGLPPPFPAIQTLHMVDEEFDSQSRYVGMEVFYQVHSSLWLTLIYQYAWADSETTLMHPGFIQAGHPDGIFISKGSTQGSNFAGSIDYYFPSNWTIGLAGGFNSSLDRERFGIEGWGLKLSIGYCLK